MANILIRDFPDKLNERLKAQAQREGMSMQILLTRLLSVAATHTPEPTTNEGTRMRMLVSESEMIHTLTGVAREVARRIRAVPDDDIEIGHDEIIDAVERCDAGTYIAMMQHLNAYREWWENHRWLIDVGASGRMSDEQRRRHENAKAKRDQTRETLRARVVAIERRSRG
jgi:hypothetical protein